MDQGQDRVLKSYCVFKLYLVRIPGWKDLRTEDGWLYKLDSDAVFIFISKLYLSVQLWEASSLSLSLSLLFWSLPIMEGSAELSVCRWMEFRNVSLLIFKGRMAPCCCGFKAWVTRVPVFQHFHRLLKYTAIVLENIFYKKKWKTHKNITCIQR